MNTHQRLERIERKLDALLRLSVDGKNGSYLSPDYVDQIISDALEDPKPAPEPHPDSTAKPPDSVHRDDSTAGEFPHPLRPR